MNIITKKITLTIGVAFTTLFSTFQAQSQLLDLSNVPVFMSTPAKPNVLLILDNSNSMDEDKHGSIPPDDTTTVEYDGGSANPTSKSEIARKVMKNLVNNYQDKLNMGLMAYKQHQAGTDAVTLSEVHNAFVDVSYSPSDHDPNWSGALDSQTKKFQFDNISDPSSPLYTNVTAPFYTTNNEGSSFCYSTTANALNNNEDILTGPWDTYRCFSSKTGTSNNLPQWQNTADEAAAGYTAYKYQFELFPTDSDIAKGIYDFGQFLHWNHVGKSWYSTNSPGRGYLHVPIATVDATQKSKLETKLGKSQFLQNKSIDPAFPLQNAGLTPLEGSLRSAKDYFSKTANASEGYDLATCNAIPQSCDKDYVILVTDGLPSVADDGTRNNSISRVSLAAAALKAAGIKTYVIGFALPFGVDSNQLNTIAIQGGTNYAYQADNEASLAEAMHSILSDIIEGDASATPVAISNQTLTDDTKAYLTSFNSADWTGNIKAYGFTSSEQLDSSPTWDIKNPATGVDPIPDHASRNIVTFKRRPYLFGQPQTPQAVQFLWSELESKQKTQILGSYCPKNPADSACNLRGEAIVNYLRGNDSETIYNFRYRSNELGDIIHSEPVYVKNPAYHYPDSLESKKYSDFKQDHIGRQAMLYVGANDGMLHAFNAETGVEQFAYIPSVVFGHISRLSSPAYAHEYFVDGSPIVVDAFFGNKWRSVLAGGFRAGGQGIYAIDVTDPDLTTSNKLKEKMLWEFSDYEDKDMGYSFSEPNIVRMHHGRWAAIFGNGYNNSQPDDFTSETGHAVLFIHELENAKSLLGGNTGNTYLKLDTGVGEVDTPNGLASVAPVDVNSDNIIDYVYAGDLRGNLWKFDLTECQTSCTPQQTLDKWQAANNPPTLLFKAEEHGTAAPQAITVRPEVGRHRSKPGLMIYFGTGKYLETTDNTRSNQVTQTLYGIWDDGSNTTLTRSKLQERKILKEVTDGSKTFRVISASSDPTQSKSEFYDQAGYSSERDDDTIKWGDIDRGYGWALDLKVSGGVSNQGERIVNRARLKDGRIIFSSMLPTDNVCDAGGEGYLIEVDAMQGGRNNGSIYDINGDGQFNDSDKKTVTINGEQELVSISGIKLNVGIPAPPSIIGVNGSDAVLVSGTSTINAQDESNPTEANNGVEQIGRKSSQPLGRQSWRQSY